MIHRASSTYCFRRFSTTAGVTTGTFIPRFYKTVSVGPCGGGWGVFLDGKILRTPGKNELRLLNEEMAFCVASEWDAQDTHIKPMYAHITY